MKGLLGITAIVTGGTGLVGSAICTRLASEGAAVVVASRTLEKANRWVADRQNQTASFIPAQLDLSDENSIRTAFDALREAGIRPGVLIANASLREGLDRPFGELTLDSFTKLFEVDIAGHFLCCRLFAERLEGRPGSIVFLSSIYAVNGVDLSIYPGDGMETPIQYCAVKAGAIGTVRTLAARWGSKGIRVNCVVAGGVQAGQDAEFIANYSRKTMLKRMTAADEVAAAVIFLASGEASYITGECLTVDGGFGAW